MQRAAQLAEFEVGLDEGLLRQVARLLKIACQVIAQAVDHIAVAIHELAKGCVVALAAAFYELNICCLHVPFVRLY